MRDARIIKPHEKIRQAVQFKGSRYGTMTVPYLIVVADCKDELRGGHIGDAALEAMFGTIVTNVWKDKNGKTVMKDGRAADGYWGTADARRHRDVSGILILPKPHLWDLRDERWQPILLRNPWAERPLPDDLLPLPGHSPQVWSVPGDPCPKDRPAAERQQDVQESDDNNLNIRRDRHWRADLSWPVQYAQSWSIRLRGRAGREMERWLSKARTR
jgi:hypothetical protein